MGSRNVSIVAAALTVLLLLDSGFVLWRTSNPPAPTPAPTPAPAIRFLQPAQPTPSSANPTPRANPITQAPVSRQPAAAAPTVAPIPVTRFEAPLNDQEIAEMAVEPTPSACPALSGRIITETINSAVLGASIGVHVYLPPCYNPDKFIYPALYLIRGTDGYGNWVKMGLPEAADTQISLGRLPPFVAVMPATDEGGRSGGKYIYSSSGRSSWEGFMLDELVPFIEQKYSVWQDRAGRAIGGISRGGYWSIEIAFQHPDLFSAVGGHSPSITSDMLIGTPAGFSMLSLARSVDAIKTLRIELDAGRDDWAQKGVNKLASDLDAQGLPCTVTSGDGIHSDNYWSSRIADYLAFYAANWPRIARARPVQIGSAFSALGQP